ncbi:ATP-binding protein [bacterium]|nr:ATP-binding protein [bacterium]
MKERDDGGFEVHGLGDPARVERELWDLLQNRQKVSVSLLREGDVEVQEVDGRRVLVVSIPPAPREHRPVFINDDVWGGSYIRVHEGDRALPRDRVRRMMADADRSRPRDGRILRNYGIDDLHEPTIQAFRQVLGSRNADHPFLREGTREFLRLLGAWGRDREEGTEGLRLAGLLLFGEGVQLRVGSRFRSDSKGLADHPRWACA